MINAVAQTLLSSPKSGNGSRVQPRSDLTSGEFRALAALGRKVDAQDPQVVRQAASQLLSELFFAPLLAEMRRFPFGRELATGGQMEAAFGQQLDQRVADSVAGSAGGLIEQVVRELEKIAPAAAAAEDPSASTRGET